MKIKIFEGENYLDADRVRRGERYLEDLVQEWLSENKYIKKIHHIKQSSAGNVDTVTTVISIWYEEKSYDEQVDEEILEKYGARKVLLRNGWSEEDIPK